MALADNPIATIGHNGGPPLDDDKLPPKHLRNLDIERLRKVEKAAKLLSALFKVAKKHILEKRTGGDAGRAIRRFLIYYMRSLGYPVWECALILELNRKQIGQEEGAYINMLADFPELDKEAERIVTMLDAGLDVDIEAFLSISIQEIDRDNQQRRDDKEHRRVERAKPKPPPPVKKPPSQAEIIQAQSNARHRLAVLEAEVSIHLSVIREAAKPGATKDQKRDGSLAADSIEKAHAEIKKLRKVVKAPSV